MGRNPVAQIAERLDRFRHGIRGAGEFPYLDQGRDRMTLGAA